MIKRRQCSTCKRHKPLTQFFRWKRDKEGRQRACKACQVRDRVKLRERRERIARKGPKLCMVCYGLEHRRLFPMCPQCKLPGNAPDTGAATPDDDDEEPVSGVYERPTEPGLVRANGNE